MAATRMHATVKPPKVSSSLNTRIRTRLQLSVDEQHKIRASR
jgi:hypothetical protein